MIVNGEAAAHPQLRVVPDAPSVAPAIEVITDDPGVQPASPWPPQIIGETCGRIYFLDAHEVDYLASAGNYVVAHVGANEYLARATLKCMSARLAPLGFVQIERSLLINLRRVAYVERQERGQFCFVMRGGTRLVSSRERSAELRAFFLRATSS
jgi:DNA-binding LytR/AlgR family response regulator